MDNNELYSEKLTRGKRSYFFDIKKSENDSLYLSITESKKKEDAFERRQIIVFEENFTDFKSVMENALDKFEDLVNQDGPKNIYSLEDVRKVHHQAYLPWSAEDDERLEALFCEGRSIKELAQEFERNEGAISSRIKKLELKEKYS